MAEIRVCKKGEIAGPAGKVEHDPSIQWSGEIDQTPLPASILAVGQEDRNQVVVVGNRVEKTPDVRRLTGGGTNRLAQGHTRSVDQVSPT